jgi:hypothetical protein
MTFLEVTPNNLTYECTQPGRLKMNEQSGGGENDNNNNNKRIRTEKTFRVASKDDDE